MLIMSKSRKVWTLVAYNSSELAYEWLISVSRGYPQNQHPENAMNRERVQDQNIPTGVNSLDSNNMMFSESLTMEGILHNYEPAAPIQDTSHNVTFEQDVIDTEDDREDNYEQANPSSNPSNNEFIEKLANIRRPQREMFPFTFI